MPALGITGGIASGKSTFVAALRRHLPAEYFDADGCAHELLAQDAGVQAAVRSAFGSDAFDQQGQPDREALRQLVFADPDQRRRLEDILHPVIRARWTTLARQAASADRWLCADIPLLYETGAEKHFTAVVVIACSPTTQRARLREQRHLPDDLAEKIIASQLALPAKIALADHLIWNESSPACLDRQSRLLAHWLQQRYA